MASFLRRLFPKKKSFKFAERQAALCTVCSHVVNESAPVLYTQKNAKGEWIFSCGKPTHALSEQQIITLQQMVNIDHNLNGLYRMPEGACAKRESEKANWIPQRLK